MFAQADYTLITETPEMHARPAVAKFIDEEKHRPSKQWIGSIIDGNQEQDEVILRTPDYVLLPDTERINRYWRAGANTQGGKQGLVGGQKRTLNWLSILNDRSVHSMRDLRGHHAPMLRAMLSECMEAIERETSIPRDRVMAYVHYPPSVYQLHVHFSSPYAQYCHRDVYRIHSLSTIINNLEIDPEYYKRSSLQVALSRGGPLYHALTSRQNSLNLEPAVAREEGPTLEEEERAPSRAG